MNSFDLAFFKTQKMSLCVTELNPNDREQDTSITSLSPTELLCSIFSLSHETQGDRNFPTALSSFCFYCSFCHVNLVSTLYRRFSDSRAIKKTKQKKIKGRHQSNLEKIRRQKNGRFPAHGRGCKWRIFKVSNPNSPRILGPHQLWPWAPAWGSRGWFGAGSDGEPQRGSVHMAKDQARLWFCTLFPMKHHFLPFHEQIQNYEKKQGLILGKSCKLRIWKVGSWTSLPPWFVTALQCTDF